MQIATISTAEIQQLGHDIFTHYRDECDSFEEASQRMVEHLFDAFRSDDEPEFSLIRVFRTTKYDELTANLKKLTQYSTGSFLTLMGTVGVEDLWCNRRYSQSRKTIPIDQDMSPMFKGVFSELGFSWEDTSSLANINSRIKAMQFNACIISRKLPVNA